MKPSDFILNSEYLSIAQASKSTIQASFAGGTFPTIGRPEIERTLDFTVASISGAIDRVLISKDGSDFQATSSADIEVYDIDNTTQLLYGFIDVSRTSPSNIRVLLHLYQFDSSATTYPAMSFTIKVDSFFPPNVF